MTEKKNPTLPGSQDGDGWFTSSYSSNANQCVEVRFSGEFVSIRDSKYRRNPANHPAQEPIIIVAASRWTASLDRLTGRTSPS